MSENKKTVYFQDKNPDNPYILATLNYITIWLYRTLHAKIAMPDLQRFTLETLIRSETWKIPLFSWLEKCLFLWISQLFLISKKCASHFCREIANDNKQFKERKTRISNSYLIRLRFQVYCSKSGTVIFAMKGHMTLRVQYTNYTIP